jgi:predicted ATPase
MKPYKLSFDEKISKIRKYLPEGLTQKILTQKNRIEGEKRQVTVMFCDLAGYSFLAQKLGPEGAYILMDQIYDILIHKVREFGGTVNELTGDGVMAASNLRSCFDVSAERGLSPFVGRNREIGILMEAFDRAKQGCGQVFSIVGEAGVGKSRLLYEFRKSVANEEITFLEGKCLSYGKYAAYHPLSDLLTSSFDVHNDDDEQEVRRKVEGVTELLHLGMEIIPFLLELQGIKNSGIDKIPMSPESRKEKTTEAVRQVILKNARRRPLVIALEDLHWVDKTSEETLRCMLDAVPGARLLLIFTYRPEYEHTWGLLPRQESLLMVGQILGAGEAEAELQKLIIEKTEGVPFFLEEFIRSLQRLDVIKKSGKRVFLQRDPRSVEIPSTIQDIIMAKVDSLCQRAKELLQAGAAIEREFSYILIRQIAGIEESDLLSYLEDLKAVELIYERDLYPNNTYVFRHAMTRRDCTPGT